jgi:hypothetical protein
MPPKVHEFELQPYCDTFSVCMVVFKRREEIVANILGK